MNSDLAAFFGCTTDTVLQIWRHPANRGRRAKTLLSAIEWQLRKRISGRFQDIGFHGMTLRVYPDARSASGALYFSGLPDYHEMNFMKRYLRRGDGFIDAGANIGVYTLLAASIVGRDGRVDAYEPGCLALERLRENVELNSLEQVHIHDAAVSSQAGFVEFVIKKEETTNRIRTEYDDKEPSKRVRCEVLDGLAGNTYAMGKLDLEGAEPIALQGARRLLEASNPPVWLVEFGGYSKQYGIPTHEMTRWLDERGFGIAIYDSVKNNLAFTDRVWAEGVKNAFAVSYGSLDFVLGRLSTGSRR